MYKYLGLALEFLAVLLSNFFSDLSLSLASLSLRGLLVGTAGLNTCGTSCGLGFGFL